MPKLWAETVEAHREAVRAAATDAAARLVAAKGVRAVTMSEVASEAGMGRATLYKYFSTVDEVLVAWHERHVGRHLGELHALRRSGGAALERLELILRTVARSRVGAGSGGLAAALHAAAHVRKAEAHLRELLAAVIREGAAEGTVRADVPAAELAEFAVGALVGGGARSRAKLDRRVGLVLDALRT